MNLVGGHRGLERRQGKLYSTLSFFVMIAPTTVNLQNAVSTDTQAFWLGGMCAAFGPNSQFQGSQIALVPNL